MTIYYVLPILTLLLGIPLLFNKSKPLRLGYITLVFGTMFVMNSLRYGIGYDYYHYQMLLDKYTVNDYGMVEMFTKVGSEPLYTILMKLVILLPYPVRYLTLNAATALITYLPVASVVSKERFPQVSTFMYICLTFFYTSMNFTRQAMAASLVFLSLGAIRNKKHWQVVLFAFIGALFHFSALVLIPIYFISLIKPSWKFYSVAGVLSAAVFVFSDKLIKFALSLVDTRYSLYIDSPFLTRGLSVYYIIIPLLIAVLHIIIYFTAGKEIKGYGIFTNFALISAVIWIFSVKHLIVERFSIYIYIFMIVSLPEGLGALYDRSRKKEGFHINSGVILTAVYCLLFYGYNDYTITQQAHGVFPYHSIISPYTINKKRLDIRPRDCYFNVPFLQFLHTIDRENCTVFAVNSGTSNEKFRIEELIGLSRFGIQNDVYGLNSYIACITDGKPAICFKDTQPVEFSTNLYEKYDISLKSDAAGGTASMIVNDVEFALPQHAMYFLVFDNNKQMIITAQGYDLSTSERICINNDVFNMLEYYPGFEDYESGLELGLIED